MTNAPKYGNAVAHSLGLNNAPLLTTRTLRKSQIGISRISCGIGNIGMTPPIPAEDTFIAAVYLTALDHHELWSRGKRVISQGYAANSLRIVNLEAEYSALITSAHEAVGFYIPRSALNELSDETSGGVAHLSCPPGIINCPMVVTRRIMARGAGHRLVSKSGILDDQERTDVFAGRTQLCGQACGNYDL